MAGFFEVPVVREDGLVGSHDVNMEAIFYVDLEIEAVERSNSCPRRLRSWRLLFSTSLTVSSSSARQRG